MRLGIALDLGSTDALEPQMERAEVLLRAAEEAGLDSVWLGESYHINPAPFHLPSPLITLAHLAAMTNLNLGTGVLLLRAYNPRQLAYEAALVDQLTRGRLTLGVGLGDKWVSGRLGQGPLASNFFDAGLELLKSSWADAGGSPDGWYTRPEPFQPGGPKLLIGGHGSRALDRAVTHGDGYFAATHYSDRLLKQRADQYWDRASDGSGEVCAARICVIREQRTEADASRAYVAPITHFYESHGIWGLGPDGVGDPSAAATLIGTPDDVAERLMEYRSWGIRRLNLRIAPIGMPTAEAVETVRLLGQVLSLLGCDPART